MSLQDMFKTITTNPNFPGVHDIEPQELLSLKEKVTIIDVRGEDEYVGELGHIDTAKLIVLNTIPQNLEQIPKNKPVVMVCRSGGRSANATAFLNSNGYDNVVNMRGGMILWNTLQFPVER